jgi:multidrug efflux pump subunit AcrA (membrane-fusion protein)
MQELQLPAATGAKQRSRGGWLAAIAVFLVFVALLVSGILERIHTNTTLRTETADTAIPTVSVVAPKRAAPSQEIVLPGNVQPFVASPVFARTNGYLVHWYFDIGAHVKKGQLLALISSPEVDQQL